MTTDDERSSGSSEERYRLLIEHAPVPHYVHDGKRLLLANQAFARMLGFQVDDLIGRELVDLVHPESRLMLRERLAKLRETADAGYNKPGLGKMLRADGSAAIVEVVAAMIEYEGKPAVQVVMLDVTERETTREALRVRDAALQQAAVRLAEAQAIARTGSWELDLATNKSAWSDEMYRILELPVGSALGRDVWLSVVHPDDREAVARRRDEIMAAREPSSSVYRLQVADGRIKHVHQQVRFERDPSGQLVRMFGTIQDVTEREAAAAERARLESQLMQAQRLEALGTLASGIAHDFNNLLTVITANAELAAGELPAEHPARENLAEVETASARGAELVRQILTVGRRHPARKVVVAPATVVDEAVRLLRSTLPKVVGIDTVVAPEAPAIEGDPAQLHQVVMNLCTNASHALGDRGGRIEVRVGGVVLDAATASLLELSAGRYLELVVADNGTGIDPETLTRIFDPFFTTKPVGVGSGLGLSVVHGIVKGHRGGIAVDSTPGRGTTFRLYFPITTAASDPEPVTPPATRTGTARHVLVVDDEHAIVQVFAKTLTKLGYVVTTFTQPEQALTTLAGGARFDIMVVDQRMPGLSGLELVRAARQLAPAFPVVLISGNLDDDLIAQATAVGVAKCLHKPCSPNTLTELLEELVGRA